MYLSHIYILIGLTERIKHIDVSVREDTHKKKFFFSSRTTKGIWRGNPPDHQAI